MNFDELIEKVKNIPYGRNANRYNFSLVLSENKGTCSSKHAFLKDFADKEDLNKFPKIDLITVDKTFGGWAAAQKKHFADGGIFDEIQKQNSAQ